jgi:hypothetical protein
MLELFRVLLGLVWWVTLLLSPLHLVLAVVRAVAGIAEAGWGNVSVTVMLLDPAPLVGLAYGTVEIADLPPGHAVVVAVMRLAMVAAWLPAVWQLRKITRHMLTQPFDHAIVRRMSLVGPLVAAAALFTAVLSFASSWVTTEATSAALPGAQPAIPWESTLSALLVAAVFVLFAEVLRAGTRLREDNDLTI